jgi:hypothetical protein
MTTRTFDSVDCALIVPSTVLHLLRVLVLFVAAVLLSTSGWLLIRRFSGGFLQPLSPARLLLLGTAWVATCAATAAMARRMPRALEVQRASLTVSGVLLGAAVWVPDTSPTAYLVFWTLIGAGAAWSWSRSGLVNGNPAAGLAAECEALLDEPEAEDGLLPAEVSQRLVRARDERGAEVIYGTLRCDFAAGERLQSLHVAFCPPLAMIAEFTTDQLAGPSVQIKTSILETFGAGLELKLASPSREPVAVQIQFFAFERSPSAA